MYTTSGHKIPDRCLSGLAFIFQPGISKIPDCPSKYLTVGDRSCCGEDRLNSNIVKLCSSHFEDSCFQRDLQNELLGLPVHRILRDEAVPTLNLP